MRSFVHSLRLLSAEYRLVRSTSHLAHANGMNCQTIRMQNSYVKGQGNSEKLNEPTPDLFTASMKNKIEKAYGYLKQLIICGFLHFSLSPKEKSRHTISRMKREWLYQFVDLRRGQRPNHNLTFIHPHNFPSSMEYCHAHDRS